VRAPHHSELVDHVREAYSEEVDRTHQSLLMAWVAFGATFGLLRALTYAIRQDLLPWGNVVAGDVHLHHYLWGVGLLLLVGLVSLIVDTPRYNPWLGTAYGVGAALVIDEFALLLNLEDVYWEDEGQISVTVALAFVFVLGCYLLAASFWRRLGREVGSQLHAPKSSHPADEDGGQGS
jgi:hypothetical protein